MTIRELLRPSLHWLLVFVPAAIILRFIEPQWAGVIFATSALGIIPLAAILGDATEQLARRTNDTIGGLLNATFGNAAEFIIGIAALQDGLYTIVKASLTGSIIGNALLVLGGSILAGGLKHKTQRFNAVAARSQSTLLTLAAIALIVPAVFHHLTDAHARVKEENLSLAIALVLLLSYGLSLLFVLHTHKKLFMHEPACEGPPVPVIAWPLSRSIAVLTIATALVAWLSEILVGAVEPAAESMGMTTLFIGVVVVAIVGNAAEHATAVIMAVRDRMDISMGVSIGSSIQIAMFVAPMMVLLSRFIGPHAMSLTFSPAEVLAVGLAVVILGQIAGDGESNWLEGVQLLAVYTIFCIIFYFLPEVNH